MRLNSENIAFVLQVCSEALEKEQLADEDVEDFLDNASGILSDYYALVGDDTDFVWLVEKKFGRVELYLGFPGKRIDPFEEGDGAQARSIWRKVKTISTEVGTSIGYVYGDGCNNVTIRAASKRESNNILKQPMVQAVLLGLVLGLICGRLPEGLSSFIVDDVASPVLNTITSVFSGIMGPIIFLSLVTSISSLGDINVLCDLGTKVLFRFLKIAATLTALSLAMAVLVFPILGADSLSLDVSQMIDLLISIVPTNMVQPFLDNNMPQLLVLSVGLGATLLVLGDQVSKLNDWLASLKTWMNKFMGIVCSISAIIPFLSIFKIAAAGNISSFIEGWRYIATIYAFMAITFVAKIVKCSLRCSISIQSLWNKVLPAVSPALATGSTSVSYQSMNEVATDELNIKEGFVSFWTSLAQRMLNPAAPAVFVLASFFVADMCGFEVGPSFLLTLIIAAIELSIAYPGTTSGLVTLFSTLGLSTDYVGLFSAYHLFTGNVYAGYCVAYRLFEEYEAATVLGAIGESEEDEGTEEIEVRDADESAEAAGASESTGHGDAADETE